MNKAELTEREEQPLRKVLLIDDDDSLRRVTEYSLHSAGFHVLSAVNGQQGLDAFRADSPQVVITDIQMPGLSGHDVLQQIKTERPETIVIVITAYSSVEKAVDAMKQGAYDYLAKPFSRDELVIVVEKAFNLREGCERKDDYLPQRFIDDPLPDGPSKGQVFEMDLLLDDYYKARGWDPESGFPTEKKLLDLGLKAEAETLKQVVRT
mgnify:CR=1 FL=1